MVEYEPGMKVVHRAQRAWGVGVVIQVADDGRRLAVRFAGRDGITVVNGRDPALTPVSQDTPIEIPKAGPLEALSGGQQGPAAAFALRARVARLEALRRADALGALLSSRVHVMPHQVGAAGRILADRAPRFVLADEVGLGKTIEAGLVFAGLRQLGIAERVVVVVPDHLAFQWLAELFHKFNALFSLVTAERVDALGPKEALQRHPWAIVPLELLVARKDLAGAAAELGADLAIVDEAHHLADAATYDAVAPLAKASFGLLLLTATPVRLDPREYFRLLGLVEPIPTASEKAFLARLERHEAYAQLARDLIAGKDPEAAAKKLAELAPDDDAIPKDRDALLAHLADRYSLSSRLIRNRRAKVGAFTARVLRREDAKEGEKLAAVTKLCVGLAERGEKSIVFGHGLDGLRKLQAALSQAGREALLYDSDAPGAPSLEARDRLVARFRDPDGPMVLLSGEAGGEGRNFQFCHHLVCLDLPESPLDLEQRIGRLDRLGQHLPVEIHVVTGGDEERFLADLYEKVIGIFDEPVGGLDAVLASLPGELAALRKKKTAKARETFKAKLAARVAEGRRAQHEGYDPLLDLRSAALPELSALVARAFERLGEEVPEGGVGEGLTTLARWLEEELEEAGTEIAARIGVEVDADQNVQPFEVAFTLGAQLRIDALPGMQIPAEPETHLGSFWRETAVARDELEWFATGHVLVEALLGLARDGEAGRAAAVRAPFAPSRGALACRYAVRWPLPADLAPGARVPSRQAARYLDGSPVAVAVDLGPGHGARSELWRQLDELLESGSAADARAAPPPSALLDSAAAAAEREAVAKLELRKKEALAALAAHAEAEEERLVIAGFAGGADRKAVDSALGALRTHRAATEAALAKVSLELDAATLLVP